MEGPNILIPYNFTINDAKCLDFAIQRYSGSPGARITIFHAYIPIPKVEIDDHTVMGRLAGNMNYLHQKITESEEGIKKAAQRLIDAGFRPPQVQTVFKPQERETAEEIVAAAREGDIDTVILNRRPGTVAKFFMASVSKKVSRALNDIEIIMVS